MAVQQENPLTIADRLRSERERLRLTQTAMGALVGASKRGIGKWEDGKSSTPTATVLAAYARAGADVQFIITGKTAVVASEALAGVTVRQALAMLDPADRHRLLLDLLAGEVAA